MATTAHRDLTIPQSAAADRTLHRRFTAAGLLLGANPRRAREGEAARREQVLRLFPRLRERAAQIARTMSGGEQQMLAIGRALMSNPDILLLDEPSLGLSPVMVQELFAKLRRVREDVACLVTYARHQQWPRPLVQSLKSFLSDLGVEAEGEE